MSRQSRQLYKGIRGEQKIPTGKVHGFKRYDKVEYLRTTCFIKARRNEGGFVLMDIQNNILDFRSIGGRKEPSYKYLTRIGARRSILCSIHELER